jgi:hypothetical protein
MTTSKANAAGVAGAVVVLILYLLQQIPAIANLPDGPATALQFLVTSGVSWIAVWLAPPNTPAAPMQVQVTVAPEVEKAYDAHDSSASDS